MGGWPDYKLYRFWTTTLECHNIAYLRFFLDDAFWSNHGLMYRNTFRKRGNNKMCHNVII